MNEILQHELLQEMGWENPPLIIDVRSGSEFESAHIRNAVHLPFYAVFWNKSRLPDDYDDPIVLTCEHGPRAVMAKSLLWLIGYRNIRLLKGHMTEWKKNRLPTT